jgi:hypothetical protein
MHHGVGGFEHQRLTTRAAGWPSRLTPELGGGKRGRGVQRGIGLGQQQRPIRDLNCRDGIKRIVIESQGNQRLTQQLRMVKVRRRPRGGQAASGGQERAGTGTAP